MAARLLQVPIDALCSPLLQQQTRRAVMTKTLEIKLNHDRKGTPGLSLTANTAQHNAL